MKPTAAELAGDKKAHICPPSDATHPSDRWESLFVYGFICRFTQLRGKEALLSREPNPIMTQILARFVLNLRPQTRNLSSSDVISSTLAIVLQEYLKSTERTVFWNEDLKANTDPFQEMPNGFFAAEWDMKLKVLRQLVELQLSHSPEVKAIIDRAWGVIHNKHKKTEPAAVPPPPEDPHSQERLQLIPIGQDKDRKRYWVIDDSPRVYMSTNPWKITATFQTVASSRDEYMVLLEKVKQTAPPDGKEGARRTKLEQAHLVLVKNLEERIQIIDNELARIQRARRKIEQRNILIASAELRETRTRRRTTRPDYAYMNDPDTEDDDDEYKEQEQGQEDEEYEDQAEFDDLGNFRYHDPSSSRRATTAARRSTRTSASSGKRASAAPTDEWNEWRGERRSTRLGAPSDMQIDGPAPKRARTEDSAVSTSSADALPTPQNGSGLKIKINGAAAVKPTETAVEVVAGKKKSKFWYYAIEPVPGAPPSHPTPRQTSNRAESSAAATRSSNGRGSDTTQHSGRRYASNTPSEVELYEKSLEGSLSPTSSMDES
nr:hypothetical protein UP11 [Mycoleptodonoides aitchisonii]